CDIILRETQRLEKMLDRIRNYLKPLEINHQECHVNTIVGDCLDLLSPEMERRKILCRLDLDPTLMAVSVDPDVLTQIFINLVRNATEAIDRGGTLLIKTYESDQNLHIEFKNPISRLTVKDPELLFLPLGKGGQSIGLPLCYRLVKKMGGILSFVQGQNQVVFTVSLPKAIGASSDAEGTDSANETYRSLFQKPDKRAHLRKEVRWPCTLQAGGKSIKGAIRDISTGGAFISCQTPLGLNESFQTVIEASTEEFLSVQSEVVWSNFGRLDTENKPSGIGVRFTGISSRGRQFLHEMISRH
ncbi:MAG: PilZ domain-containing protein, partial [Deltaproteobacteria bacterium]